jgi:hypothetical protein
VQEGRDVISLALFLLFEEAPQPRTRFFHDWGKQAKGHVTQTDIRGREE